MKKGYDFIVVQSAGNGNSNGNGVDYHTNLLYSSIDRGNCWEDNRISQDDIIDRIIIVSAINPFRELTYFSNGVPNGDFGDLHIIAAPGEKILSSISGLPFVKNNVTYSDYND